MTDKDEENDALKAKTTADEAVAKKSGEESSTPKKDDVEGPAIKKVHLQKIEDLEEGFNAIVKEIAVARFKRDEFNNKTQEIIRALKENNSQVKEHIKKAQELKEKRDSFNENVQAAKNSRATTQAALDGLRKKLVEIKEKDKGGDTHSEYDDLVAKIPAYDQQSEKYHNEVILNSQESQKYHELMLKEFQVVDSLRDKISMLEEELDDNRKKADQVHAQLIGDYKKREDMRDEIISMRRETREPLSPGGKVANLMGEERASEHEVQESREALVDLPKFSNTEIQKDSDSLQKMEEAKKGVEQETIDVGTGGKKSQDPLKVLKMRLAKGEISKDEYLELKKMLDDE